jgi:DNA-binding transcriptional LysR family regulator
MDRLNAMELFVRVVETGSFSAVAREMDMTQPTVSKQLAGLEARLKTRLLNRSTRQLSLTEAGTSYYEACKRILDGVREAEGNLGKLQGRLAGTLRLNTSIALGQMYVSPLAIKFQKAHPEIEIDLQLQDRFVDLVEEGIDVAIRVGRLTDSTLVKKHGTPKVPQDLASHNCILYAYLSTGNEWLFQGPEGEIRVKVTGSFRANNGDAIRQAVLADLGVAVGPEWIVHDDIAAGTLRPILPDFAPTPLEVNAVFTSARHVSTKVRAFIEFLQAEFPNYPALRSV